MKEGMKMQTAMENKQNEKLVQFCQDARQLIMRKEYEKCYEIVCATMSKYPDTPQPHNILGILLEKTGHHSDAMHHFRAALALDGTYRPASQNLETYGTFYYHGACAFDEMDCELEGSNCCTVVYDNPNIRYAVRRK